MNVLLSSHTESDVDGGNTTHRTELRVEIVNLLDAYETVLLYAKVLYYITFYF